LDIRTAVLALRKLKLVDPKRKFNAGSFFKNPIVDTKIFKLLKVKNPNMPFFELKGGKYKLFAGWLIENAGWKGRKYKNAAVSSKNALVLTNTDGKATFSEINGLSDRIIEDIKAKYSIVLEPEVQFVGGK
jgi:UDP-N-acetylmuramate dehydrogenase